MTEIAQLTIRVRNVALPIRDTLARRSASACRAGLWRIAVDVDVEFGEFGPEQGHMPPDCSNDPSWVATPRGDGVRTTKS